MLPAQGYSKDRWLGWHMLGSDVITYYNIITEFILSRGDRLG